MKALVTGSSGVLGHALAPQLAARGDALRFLDLVPAPETLRARLREAAPDCAFEEDHSDMRDSAALRRACAGVDVVYHLAAGQRMKPQFASFSEDEIFRMNLEGVANVLAAARAESVGKVVFISSSAVYGVPATALVDEDDHPKRPIGAYGHSKLEAEGLCRQAVEDGLDVVVLRPMSLFGDGMTGVFVLLFDWVRRRRRIFLLGRGENRVQMVAAADVAQAAISAATTAGTNGLVVNIGSDPGSVPTVREQVEALLRHARVASPITSFPAALLRNAARALNLVGLSPIVPEHYLLADANFILDISRARERLGWEPRGNNVTITCDAYDWYLRNWQSVTPKLSLPLRVLEALT